MIFLLGGALVLMPEFTGQPSQQQGRELVRQNLKRRFPPEDYEIKELSWSQPSTQPFGSYVPGVGIEEEEIVTIISIKYRVIPKWEYGPDGKRIESGDISRDLRKYATWQRATVDTFYIKDDKIVYAIGGWGSVTGVPEPKLY